MRPVKYIVLSSLLTIGIFCAVFYTSCSKDACKAVTCINGGNCGGGVCSCRPGIGGSNCQTVYRVVYTGTYTGNAVYSVVDTNLQVGVDTNSTLVFSAGTDSNFNHMSVLWNRGSAKPVNMNITLANNSSTASDFSIDATTVDSVTYTGTGTVSATSASMNLTGSKPNTQTVAVTISNFARK